jgi:hypothetical protein
MPSSANALGGASAVAGGQRAGTAELGPAEAMDPAGVGEVGEVSGGGRPSTPSGTLRGSSRPGDVADGMVEVVDVGAPNFLVEGAVVAQA